MIDTHCHLLPGVDDGPSSLDEALDLARELVRQGVSTAVCTPHWSRRFETTHAQAQAAAAELREGLHRDGVPLELLVAAELTEVVAVSGRLTEIAERSLAGRAVIVELLPESLLVHTRGVVARLSDAGLTTVLAHPERCRGVQADKAQLDALRERGALVQVVAPSLTGRWGDQVQATTWELLFTDRVDLVASDAHDLRTRPCELEVAASLVADRLGQEIWDELARHSPARLLARESASTP